MASRTSTETIALTPIAYPASAPTLASAPSQSSVPLSGPGSSRASEEQRSLAAQDVREELEVSRKQTLAVITSVTCVTGISSLLSGLVAVGLPTIARDLGLGANLLLWPASIYALTCGCSLLLLGSIADVVGSRPMYLVGCVLQSAFTLACGLSRNGTELILYRALAGVAISFCLPSAVSILTNTFPPGKRRNAAFASMGGGQPIGFSLGLTLGGVFADSIGWRWGFHIAAILNTVIFVLAVWGLPKDLSAGPVTWERLIYDIDWVGALIASASLAMMSYVFAIITGAVHNIREPSTIALLATSVALVPAFILWVGRQERLNRPAIIPNSLWRNKIFTTICINVFLTWGTFNAIENILTFFFQYVQGLSAIQASVRFLPAPLAGVATNIVMGLIVHRVRANTAVLIATSISLVSPLLLALASPRWSYWASPFPAILLNPVGADTLFTISNLLITSVFPAKTQGLAGGVFNTVAQIGKSVGLASAAVIAGVVTARVEGMDKESPEALMAGYRATYFYCFALTVTTLGFSVWGLRKIGMVGIKRE